MSQVIPETYAVTIATWSPAFISGKMRRFRAVRPIRSFHDLGPNFVDWFDGDDEYYNKKGNTRTLALVQNTDEQGDRVLVAFHYLPMSTPVPMITADADGNVIGPPDWSDLHVVSMWTDVLGQEFSADEFRDDLPNQWKRMRGSPFREMLKPVIPFDVELYRLLGVDMPWMQPLDDFQAWLKEIKE